MSDKNVTDDNSDQSHIPHTITDNNPLIVVTDPFSEDIHDRVPTLSRSRRSVLPSLTLETDLDTYPERGRSPASGAVDSVTDDEDNLSPTGNKSPVSSFFQRLTRSTSRSNHDRLTPNTRKVVNMVPYINTPDHSSASLEVVGTPRNSLSLEDADPDVINRGLQVALGDGFNATGGLWLPLSPDRKSKRDSGHFSSNDEYSGVDDDSDERLSEFDNNGQEGIPLRDLHLNVPSYPEYLASTTSPVPEDELNASMNQDSESGLKVPTSIQTPTTPRQHISNAFKKFSARVNGKDDEEDDEVEDRRKSYMSTNSNQDVDIDEESDSYEDDISQKSIYSNWDVKLKEGSSESHNEDVRERTYSNAKDEDTLYPDTLRTDDELSMMSTRLSGFDVIRSYSNQREDKPLQEPEKEGIRLFGNSLKYFAPTNSIRMFCASIVMQKWFEFSITVLTFLQAGLLSYEQWDVTSGYFFKGRYTSIDWVLFVINSLHTIEIGLKIITFGLIDDSQMFKEMNITLDNKTLWNDYIKYNYERFKNRKNKKKQGQAAQLFPTETRKDGKLKMLDASGDFFERRPLPLHSVTAYELEDTVDYSNTKYTRAFLRSSWNRIDFVSNVSFWLSFLLSIDQYDLKHHIMLFRSLMCLRILRLTNFTYGTSVILKAVKKASPELMDVALLLGSFWVFFAIIGVQSFKSSFRRQCVWINPDNSSDYYVNTNQYCGSYLEPGTLELQPYVFNDGSTVGQIKGFRCPVNSRCVSNQNPYDNTVSFDNIANSFELVFVVMSANTFTDLMYYTMDSDTMSACLFFIFGVFFLTVWIVNLLIAVIVNAFTITRDEMILQRKKMQKAKNASQRSKLIINEFKKKSRKLRWYYKLEPIFLIFIAISLLFKCWAADVINTDRVAQGLAMERGITVVLFIEALVRFCCYLPQWRYFFYSKQNVFDSFIALITLIIAAPAVTRKLGRAYAWLTFFQIARWYRVVLAVEFTRKTWLKVLGHVKTIIDLSLFYFIFLFLTGIITSRFFEGTLSKDDLEEVPFSMYNLPNSLISLYAISSTENWTSTLYSVQQYAKNKSQQFFGAAYLIVWFMFSNMIILNIFIAVISENLSVPESDKRRAQIVQYLYQLRDQLKKNSEKGILADFKDRVLQSRSEGKGKGNLTEEIWYMLLSGKANSITETDGMRNFHTVDDTVIVRKNRFQDFWFKIPFVGVLTRGVTSVYRAFKTNPFLSSADRYQKLNDTGDLANAVQEMMNDDKLLDQKRKDFLKENPTFNTVLYMLPPNHRLRKFCQAIVPSSYGDRVDGVKPGKTLSFVFNCFMFVVTVSMVVIACYTTPLYKKNHLTATAHIDWIMISDITFTLLFTTEFIIKIIADGFVFTPNAYLASSWNNIDLVVLLTLWINVITTLKGTNALSNLVNGFKALRALRLLTLSTMSKNTFQNTVISGFGQMMSAATISMTLLFPFAIWGGSLFSERLGYCLDGTSMKDECLGEFTNEVFKWDIVSPNSYVEPILHLNNFRDSFLSLFEIISLEGWTDLLQNLMNSTGIGTPPDAFATPFNGFFVVIFNFVSTIFILNLFVSVIIQKYSRNTGRAYQTNEQSAWYEVEKILRQVKASKRGDVDTYPPLKLLCHKLIIQRNKYWKLFINLTFVLHIIALLLEVYPSIRGLDATRYGLYMVTSCIFFVHLILVIIARGPKYYFSSKWSWVVVFLISGAFSTSVISFFVSRETTYANINKLFLVGVLLLIIPRINRLEQLLRYAIASLPSLGSLLFTWGILFLVYAIALNQIFGLTRTGPDTSNNINTRTVTKSLILLFRMSFGEGWNYIMNDYTVKSPNCYSSDNIYQTDCGHEAYAYLLFISWNILSMFIFLNMFVSLIVDNFSYIYHASDPHSYITRAERRKFKQSWLKFDPRGTGYIDPKDLIDFLGSLSGALSYKIYNDGRFTIPELKKKWFQKVDDDPYSVFIDYPAMNSTLSQIDPIKVRIRRLKYERLVEEILSEMRATNAPGISFTSVILKVAMYAHFEESKCLTLNDFMKRYVSMDKVDARLKQQKVYDTLKTVIARWRYKEGRYDSLVQSNEYSKSVETFDVFGVDKPKAPLIFISEYLRSDSELSANGDLNKFGRNNNTVYDDDGESLPLYNPFSDKSAVDPFEDSFASSFDNTFENEYSSNKSSKSVAKSADLTLHQRRNKDFSDRQLHNPKIVRDLTGSSSALNEPPITVLQKTPITRFNESMNQSKDSLFSTLPHGLTDDADTGSLMSIDLNSPRR